jgi:predicted regulator of amino acid metabolism with ACT domain
MINEVDTLMYVRHSDEDSVEPHRVVFEFNTGPTVADFKIICMRMASALGYDERSIREVFGNIPDESLDNIFNNITGKEEIFKK